MKKYFLTLSLFLLFSLFAQSQKFILSGKIIGQTSGYVHLFYQNSNGKNVNDSCALKNGSFQFIGNIAGPTICYFQGNVGSNDMNDPNSTSFFLQSTTIHITVKKDDFKNAIISGSKTEDENVALEKLKEPVHKEMQSLIDAYDKANNSYMTAVKNKKGEATLDSLKEKAADLHEQFEPYIARINKIDYEFFASHPNSYVTAFMMRFHVNDLSLDSLQMFYNNMNETLRQSTYGRGLAKEIQKLRDGSPGSMAKDFTTKDISGKTLSLSDFKGKYILLDFWASWCVPCRKSNPHLKELYAQYKDKSFEIVGVSDNDNDTAAWKKAVEKDGLPWRHVLRGIDWTKIQNGEENPNDISEKYGIHSLPTKILIDAGGTIIGRYGEGRNDEDAMDKKLSEVLNK